MMENAGRSRATLAGHIRSWRTTVMESVKDLVSRARAVGFGPARGRSTAQMHVLMIDDLVPDPLFGAGYPRAFAIVRSFVKAGHRVSFYPMRSSRADRDRMSAAFSGIVTFHHGAGARGLRRLLWTHGSTFDAVFVSRPIPMAALVQARWPMITDRSIPVIYDAEAVLAPREARRRHLFETAWSDAEYETALAAELEVARDADVVTAVGQGDAATIRSVLDKPVFVVPHPVTARQDASFDDRQDILFVGRLTGSPAQSPNVDSVVWFLQAVMPILDGLIGTGYRLHVVGRAEAPEIQALASDRIVLHGVVHDLRPLYDHCRVFVAPTRYAAGIPLKVMEAMGEGIPCVVTPLLAEQLAAGSDVLAVGDGAQGFAETCARLYTDTTAWQAARDAGTAYVRRCLSPQAFDHALQEVLDHVAGPSRTHIMPSASTIG